MERADAPPLSSAPPAPAEGGPRPPSRRPHTKLHQPIQAQLTHLPPHGIHDPRKESRTVRYAIDGAHAQSVPRAKGETPKSQINVAQAQEQEQELGAPIFKTNANEKGRLISLVTCDGHKPRRPSP